MFISKKKLEIIEGNIRSLSDLQVKNRDALANILALTKKTMRDEVVKAIEKVFAFGKSDGSVLSIFENQRKFVEKLIYDEAVRAFENKLYNQVGEAVESEKFIDEIIARVNKKQLER